MSRYRGRNQIYYDVLKSCFVQYGVKKTHIMYNSHLSYFQLQTYLTDLIDKGIIEVKNDDNGTILYFLTDKGRDAFKKLAEIEKIFKDGS